MNGWEEEVEWPPHHPQATSTRISDVRNIGIMQISITLTIVAAHTKVHNDEQTSDEKSDATLLMKPNFKIHSKFFNDYIFDYLSSLIS